MFVLIRGNTGLDRAIHIATVSALQMLIQYTQRMWILSLLIPSVLVTGCEKPIENTPQIAEKETGVQPPSPPIEPRTIRTPVQPPSAVKREMAQTRKKMKPRWTEKLPVHEVNIVPNQWVWAVIASQYDEQATVSTFRASPIDKNNVRLVDTFGKDQGSVPAVLVHAVQSAKVAVGDWVLADRPDANAVLGQVTRIVGKDTWVRYEQWSTQKTETALFPIVEPVRTGPVPLGWVFFRKRPNSAWQRGLVLVVDENQTWVWHQKRTVHIIDKENIRPFQWMQQQPDVGTAGLCAYQNGAYEKCVVTKATEESNQIQVEWPHKKASGTIKLADMTREIRP